MVALLGKPGFFAGGGLVREERTAVQSVADGRVAAKGIDSQQAGLQDTRIRRRRKKR